MIGKLILVVPVKIKVEGIQICISHKICKEYNIRKGTKLIPRKLFDVQVGDNIYHNVQYVYRPRV